HELIEDALNEKIVTGVQDGPGPQASRLEPHPREDEADRHYHDSEAGEGVPAVGARVVIGKQQNRAMPRSPDHAADEAELRERSRFRQLRNKESSPANFFSQSGTEATDHPHSRREKQIQGQDSSARHPAKPKDGCDFGYELRVESALPRNPDCAVGKGCVCQWKKITEQDISPLWPRPAQGSQIALQDP